MEAMADAGAINYPPSFNRFIEVLKEKAETSAKSLEIQKSNIFTRLESASPEEVAKIVFRPKSSEDILRVKNLVSEEAFLDIQDQALEQILKDSVQTGSTKLADIFKPGNLERALRTYDNETLTAMFGKDLTQSLNNYSRQLRVTIGDEITGGAGSLVAGALALNVFNVALWPTVAMQWVFIKQFFLTLGLLLCLLKQTKALLQKF
jgi:threonine synthase